MTTLVGAVLQVLGLAAVCAAAFMVDVTLGVLAVGVALFAIGFVLERGE